MNDSDQEAVSKLKVMSGSSNSRVTRKMFTKEELDAVDLDSPKYYLYRNREMKMTLLDDFILTLTFPIGVIRFVIIILLILIWITFASMAHWIGLGHIFLKATSGFSNYAVLVVGGFIFRINGQENFQAARENANKEDRALFLISNHISSLDPHAVSAALGVPFRPIMKQGVFDIPVYGKIAKIIGAIGVDRSKASGTVNTITRYFADSTKDDIPLYMCPEGSTTNGDGLIRFKRGTFLPDVEVVPVCLHFECPNGVSVCLNQPSLYLDVLQIIRFISCLTPKYINVYILPPMRRRNEEDFQEYADRVGRSMADALNIQYELERTNDEAVQFYTALEHQYHHRTGKFSVKVRETGKDLHSNGKAKNQ